MSTLAQERTWYVNGFSKSLSPGLRVGTLVPPERQHARADVMLQATTLAVSPLMAELVTRWIQDGTAENIATALRAEAQTRLATAASALGDLLPAVPVGRLPPVASYAVASRRGSGAYRCPGRPHRHAARTILTDPSATESGLRVCIGRPGTRQLVRGLRRLRNIIVSHITSPASTHSR